MCIKLYTDIVRSVYTRFILFVALHKLIYFNKIFIDIAKVVDLVYSFSNTWRTLAARAIVENGF